MKKDSTKLTLFDNQALKKLIIPLVIEQLLNVLVGMADSLMVSNVGEAAVSAVSLCDSVNWIIIVLFAALATGGAVVAGQALGMKDMDRAKTCAGQLVMTVLAISLVIMAGLYLLKNVIISNVFGSIEPDVRQYCYTYYTIVAASIPFIALYNAGAALFRTMGNSAVTMKVSLLMNVINIGGNAVLIYGLHMEVAGAAIPTTISRAVAALLILYLLRNKELTLNISNIKSFRPDFRIIRQIFVIGIPNGIENSIFQVGKVLVLSMISTMGTASIAANAVGSSLGTFEILPGTAINLAILTVVSRCVGAGDYEQARGYTIKLLKWIISFQFICNVIMFAALHPILDLYNLSDEAHNITWNLMAWHTFTTIWLWPISFSLPNALRAAGDVKFTMIISIISMWTCRCLGGYIFGIVLGGGVWGVWMAMFLDWVFRSTFFVIRYRGTKWQHEAIK